MRDYLYAEIGISWDWGRAGKTEQKLTPIVYERTFKEENG